MNSLVRADTRDLSALVDIACDSVSSPHSKRAYRRCLQEYLAWHAGKDKKLFCRMTVQAFRAHMEDTNRSPSSINQALAALRTLAREASAAGLMDHADAVGIATVRGARARGRPAGNWLSADETRRILAVPDRHIPTGLHDAVVLGILLGCGLRRSELCALSVSHFQLRDGRTCIVDLRGKGARIRTIPVPDVVWSDVSAWIAGRRLQPPDRIMSVSTSTVWRIVRRYGAAIGRPEIAPHDLRRTYAKLAREAGAPLEMVQEDLGHASTATTDLYTHGGRSYVSGAGDFVLAAVSGVNPSSP